MIITIAVAMLACVAIGYFIGWLVATDRQERRAEQPREPVSVVTAAESDEFWEGVYAGSHARVSPRVTAGGGFPALPAAQAPLRELVQPGRTTDFIDKVRADTDRWLAARGLVDS